MKAGKLIGIALVFIVISIVARKIWSSASPKTEYPESVVGSRPSAVYIESPRTPQLPLAPSGWREIGTESGYKMFEPENEENAKETEWLPVTKSELTYRLHDCVMMMKLHDGAIMSFRHSMETNDKYLETSPGVFSEDKWTGYDEAGSKVIAIKFKKDGEKPLSILVGKRRLGLEPIEPIIDLPF